MLRFIVAAYRAFPIRPRCNRVAGYHSTPCRVSASLGIIPDWCKDLPGPIDD